MNVLEKIPSMNDNQLSTLLSNAQRLIYENKRLEKAKAVVRAIQDEWSKRLAGYRSGSYKADTPEEGLLKRVGYKVGNSGESTKMRHQLLDFIITGVLPPVGSPAYMAEWGTPDSKVRYRKLHRVIRTLASSGGHFSNMEKAVDEWEDDLSYLEREWRPKYYFS